MKLARSTDLGLWCKVHHFGKDKEVWGYWCDNRQEALHTQYSSNEKRRSKGGRLSYVSHGVCKIDNGNPITEVIYG